MTTSDWALIISIFSLLIALAGFVWNIWSKFIYPKPRVRVSLMIMKVLQSQPKRRYLQLVVINFGPDHIIIDCAIAMPTKPWYKRKIPLGMLNPIHDLSNPEAATGPFGGGLPKRLDPGEEFALYFPYDADMWLKEPLQAIGVHDSYRRSHWAPRRDFLTTVNKWKQEFS
jgi:hypothetical protein